MQELEWGAPQRISSLGSVLSTSELLEKVDSSPKESQDMKVLQKELEQLARPLKQKRSTVGHT